jgi:uracil-DNA glycosylase
VTVLGPEGFPIRKVVGRLKEHLEFQKELGRRFLPCPEKIIGVHFLPALSKAIIECRKCVLAKVRLRAVPGQGPAEARLMLIGGNPGFEEERLGQPFAGPAGQLLTKMIQAIQLNREELFLTYVLKCRAPENREPLDQEIEACQPYLWDEIRLVNPSILVALGRSAARALTRSREELSVLRGRFLDFQGRSLMVTYPPDFLLRNPGAKREAWEDLKKIRCEYDRLGK